MSGNDHDEPGAPLTHEDAVAGNVDLIRSYQQDPSRYLSTSQQIMVGLALCRPELLAQANFPPTHVKTAWARLDDSQRQAVLTWWI
ncbi:hypothetical protein RHDC4_00763 [Rhodocyclaceae bacterium]|nr:hypothetical protein RHDC4_00763 [Rhodocyclaceae bacterium]